MPAMPRFSTGHAEIPVSPFGYRRGRLPERPECVPARRCVLRPHHQNSLISVRIFMSRVTLPRLLPRLRATAHHRVPRFAAPHPETVKRPRRCTPCPARPRRVEPAAPMQQAVTVRLRRTQACVCGVADSVCLTTLPTLLPPLLIRPSAHGITQIPQFFHCSQVIALYCRLARPARSAQKYMITLLPNLRLRATVQRDCHGSPATTEETRRLPCQYRRPVLKIRRARTALPVRRAFPRPARQGLRPTIPSRPAVRRQTPKRTRDQPASSTGLSLTTAYLASDISGGLACPSRGGSPENLFAQLGCGFARAPRGRGVACESAGPPL